MVAVVYGPSMTARTGLRVPGWALVSAVAAPVSMIGGWILADSRQQSFDAVGETITALATRGGRGAEVRADRLGAFLGFMTATTVPFASVNLPVPHVPRRRSRGYDTTRPHRRQPDIIPSSVGPVRQARGRCPRPAYGCGGSALPPRVTVDRAHRRSRQSYVSPRGVAPAAVSLVALVTVTTNRSSSPASLVSR